MIDLKKKIEELKELKPDMFENDYLLTWEKSDDDIKAILLVAEILKEMHKENISTKIFESGLAISNFRDNSTRTRYSFSSASNALGLSIHDLDEGKSQIAHGETVRETANMLSFLTDVIGIRDDMYLHEGHKYMQTFATSIQEGYDKKILHNRPTLVNLQSDIDHPTQSMADLAKLKDYFGGLENLKGKKIAMTWAYSPSYGKPLSVAQGMIGLMTRFGAEVVLSHPKGYELLPEVLDVAEKQSKASGGKFTVTNSMEEAFENADMVCPKSWASMEVMVKRPALLHANDLDGLARLEKEALAENANHKDWECTESMMKKTNNALYMHPLPADITGVSCEEGEVSKKVFDENLFDTYTQASWKPFIVEAVIFLQKIKDSSKNLDDMLTKSKKRLEN
ncbi:MAG: knotted carbamoyltransferase YgeW [Candidatus Cloacimonadota bacterium]|nr:knotted carbamoyltransferase YgeW [Candidatus Cloacimonadota bacterium]